MRIDLITRRLFYAYVLSALFITTSQAATYYTGAGGNNGNSCATAQTDGTHKLTIGAGVSCLAAGDTLIVKSGTYAEAMINTIPSGTSGNPTIVKSQVPLGARITPVSYYIFSISSRSYITIQDFDLDASGCNCVGEWINLGGTSNNIVIQGNKIHGGRDNHSTSSSLGIWTNHSTHHNTIRANSIYDIGQYATAGKAWYTYGIYLHGDDYIIENNDIRNCSGFGIHAYNAVAGTGNRNIIRNNWIHHNGLFNGVNGYQSGIIAPDGGVDNQIYGNLIYNNGFYGIQVGGYGVATAGALIYNNTIHANGGCIRLGSQYSGPSGTIVRNNICFQNGNGNTVSYNNTSGSVETNNTFTGDPLFVNASVNNYHLQAGSPAIDTGFDTNPPVVFDKEGTAHNLPMERGAYVFAGGVVVPVVLVFTMPPRTTIEDVTMAEVQVCAEDTAGARQTSFSANISLALGANPGSSTLTGGAPSAPVSGCRSFTGISLDNIGVGYTFVASATGASSVTSGLFNIVALPEAPTLLRLNRVP